MKNTLAFAFIAVVGAFIKTFADAALGIHYSSIATTVIHDAIYELWGAFFLGLFCKWFLRWPIWPSNNSNSQGYKVGFDPAAVAMLDEMARDSGALTRKEVLVKAGGLYHWYLKEKKSGSHIWVQRAGEENMEELDDF